MKKYGIKYEAYGGNVSYVEVMAHSEQHALSMISYKEIYFIKIIQP